MNYFETYFKMKPLFRSASLLTRSQNKILFPPLQFNFKKRGIFVSATSIKNYIIGDKFSDWLKFSKKSIQKLQSKGIPLNRNSGSSFKQMLFKEGDMHEIRVIEFLRQSGLQITELSSDFNDQNIAKTKELIQQNVPAIWSGSLKGKENIGGIADLIVRYDQLHYLGNVPRKETDEKKGYVIAEIKFSTLPFSADGIHCRNTGLFSAYKSQVWVYTKALAELQNDFNPMHAFLIGRNREIARVDFANYDAVSIEKTRLGIEWIRRVKTEGQMWADPTQLNIRPNMCIDSGEYNEEKRRVALQTGDITLLWMCGERQREKALKQGIFSFYDINCTASALGFFGERQKIVDNIITVNRKNGPTFLPKSIESREFDWRRSDKFEAFVDFETIPNIFYGSQEMIFLIGVGWLEKGKWCFRSFEAYGNTLEEEFKIMSEFFDFVQEKSFTRLWNWSAEERFWSGASERQFEFQKNHIYERENILSDWGQLKWCDLSKILRAEGVAFKGCFGFGLKDITKAMANLGLINTNEKNSCISGMNAVTMAIEYYTKRGSLNLMKEIKIYNELDCKLVNEILIFLRKNM